MNHPSLLKTLCITTFLVSTSAGWAFAQDINGVGERLKAVMENQGMTISWASIGGDASEMVLDGVKVGVEGNPDEFHVGQVTLSDITEDNGGYLVGTVTLPDYNISEGASTISVSGMEMSGLRLAAADATDPYANFMVYDTADVKSLKVTNDGKNVFSLAGAHSETTMPADGNPMTFTVSTDGWTADLSSVKDPKAKALLEALGYQTMSGDIEMTGSWQPSDGRMEISTYDIKVDNAGTLGIKIDLGGYTPAFIQSLQDMQKQMAEKPAGADNSAQGLAMLGLMQQLTFHDASIRFDDDSLTGKLLQYAADAQGSKPADVANQAKALAPLMLAQVIQDQDLIRNVTEAVTTFLDDPRSLEIKAAPAQAVPFALIAAGAMSAPQELPKTLGVTVKANN